VITSKLTSKAQTTIPQPVRAALGLKAGDVLLYEIDEQCVILSRTSKAPKPVDPFRTFHEWHSEAYEKAYGRLQVVMIAGAGNRNWPGDVHAIPATTGTCRAMSGF